MKVSSSRMLSSTATTTTTAASNGNKTRYTLDDQTCPPMEQEVLSSIVAKHVQNRYVYHSKKKIASHTRLAFQQCLDFLSQFSSWWEDRSESHGIILDSGCGTGRSSLYLGKMYPHHIVIGVDRSLVRLSRNVLYRKQQQLLKTREVVKEDDDDRDDEEEWRLQDDEALPLEDDEQQPSNLFQNQCNKDHNVERFTRVLQGYPNVLLVRAELSDFWRCILEYSSSLQSAIVDPFTNHTIPIRHEKIRMRQEEIPYSHQSTSILPSFSNTTLNTTCTIPIFPPIVKHYILYPNPYPKKARLKSRWYAHPSFPFLLQLGGDIIVRSNWDTYLQEFARAVLYSSQSMELELSFLSSSLDQSHLSRQNPYQKSPTNFAQRYLSYSDVSMTGTKILPQPQRINTASLDFIPMTNFEKKYHLCGESMYELFLPYHS